MYNVNMHKIEKSLRSGSQLAIHSIKFIGISYMFDFGYFELAE